jgi:hypothetical protein
MIRVIPKLNESFQLGILNELLQGYKFYLYGMVKRDKIHLFNWNNIGKLNKVGTDNGNENR